MTNWKHITQFRPEEFAGGQFFLVWVRDSDDVKDGRPVQWSEQAQWVESNHWAEQSDGSICLKAYGQFEGTWRHIDETSHLEPIAFAKIDPCTFFQGDAEPEGEANEPVEPLKYSLDPRDAEDSKPPLAQGISNFSAAEADSENPAEAA